MTCIRYSLQKHDILVRNFSLCTFVMNCVVGFAILLTNSIRCKKKTENLSFHHIYRVFSAAVESLINILMLKPGIQKRRTVSDSGRHVSLQHHACASHD